ncbi:MAG: twin-arginine translocase TatA/TatE family subunit [Myxococcales bacterium]|nr:twin-arginine translocase TatA/TatE family subunit [Myxococcales bacterium]
MFGLGTTELVVIMIVALLVLGPKRLPDLASGLGKAIRQFRRATRDLTDQIEVDDSVRQPFLELKTALRDEPAPVPRPKPAPGQIPEAAAQPAAVLVAAPDRAEDCLAPPHPDAPPPELHEPSGDILPTPAQRPAKA